MLPERFWTKEYLQNFKDPLDKVINKIKLIEYRVQLSTCIVNNSFHKSGISFGPPDNIILITKIY